MLFVLILGFCSSYEVRPSENDLVDCKAMIEEAIKHDEQLTKSEVCLIFCAPCMYFVGMLYRFNLFWWVFLVFLNS